MTDTRRSRSERDGHIAKVIPLRRSTLSVDQPASDLSGLVQRAGTTFTELVAMAEDYGLDVPERVQLAAVLLDVRLRAAATTRRKVRSQPHPLGRSRRPMMACSGLMMSIARWEHSSSSGGASWTAT